MHIASNQCVDQRTTRHSRLEVGAYWLRLPDCKSKIIDSTDEKLSSYNFFVCNVPKYYKKIEILFIYATTYKMKDSSFLAKLSPEIIPAWSLISI